MSQVSLAEWTQRARAWATSLPARLSLPSDQADPSAPLFRRIRRDMTLLYAVVLLATLLIAGVIIYLATEQVVLATPQSTLDHRAVELTRFWEETGINPCAVGQPTNEAVNFIACYNAQGNLIGQNRGAEAFPQFVQPSLARQVLRGGGIATDQIGSLNSYTSTLREAVVAYSPLDNSAIGVVQVGVFIAPQLSALHTLLVVLILVGILTVMVSAAGGFVLSARSLLPARMAYTRQQRFIGDVSHELRTPLTLLRADAEVLLRGRDRLPEGDAELLEDIVSETAHLASLTNSLLTLARLDSGTTHAERDVVELGEIVSHVAGRARAFASERNVTVRADGPAGVVVLGAPDLLEQAAMILVDNAIKYNSPGGNVEIRSERAGANARLVVQDTGIGIEPQHLAHLGERFYRPDKARSRREGGAGLGLSIARRIAEMQGGTLTLESVPGKGTTATITLPALETHARAGVAP